MTAWGAVASVKGAGAPRLIIGGAESGGSCRLAPEANHVEVEPGAAARPPAAGTDDLRPDRGGLGPALPIDREHVGEPAHVRPSARSTAISEHATRLPPREATNITQWSGIVSCMRAKKSRVR